MWIFAKLKLRETLLVIAVCLLAALVYETHNAPGRYIVIDASSRTLLGEVSVVRTDQHSS